MIDEENQAEQMAINARRAKLKKETFNGHVRSAVMAVKALQKPYTIKDVVQIVQKVRRRIAIDDRADFDRAVKEGLKEETCNYFIA